MRKPRLTYLALGIALAGSTVAGLALSQGRQYGTLVSPEYVMPPDAYSYPCPDGKRLNQTYQFHVIIENSYAVYQGEHDYKFFFTAGSRPLAKLGTTEYSTTYLFSDVRSSPDNFTPRAWLIDPEARGRCYREDLVGDQWVAWFNQMTVSGVPKPDPVSTATTNQLKEKEEAATPTTETWCMWRNTWNSNWTEIIAQEVIMCWTIQVT